ncbi:MAG: insulinase family protein, partial [Pseudohongiellaceae bacterium]
MPTQESQASLSSPSANQTHAQGHPAFRCTRRQRLETLNVTVEEYQHIATGAVHYHLASDNPENVFMVAFRTVPMDSTGVAHILEHTALCGSRKFPVRDPFFMMIRRSMNTFMNAFTSSDWTAYPFASQNRKDFNNLLEVYLDAAFFSSLNELDFAQEGHRMEFAEPNNPETDLVYRGVVYNEMKGAMSSPNAAVWQLLCKHLFPTTTYHYNSGGEPADIPNLSYQQLLAFHKTHYHPSNAMFMTFGDIPAAEHQQHMEELALRHFERLDIDIHVGDEQRYSKPLQVEEYYALDEEDISNKTHVVLAWLLGKSTDLEELYRAQLLTSVLLDNSASPLLQAIETTDLGRSPSPLCGLEDSYREMSFICGLEACSEDSADKVEKLILDTLEQVAVEGIPQDKVEAALHSLELQQREISGDSYPYGLQLIMAAMSPVTHGGDPIELLDIDPVLNNLKQEIQDPDFIPGLIRSYLLDNPHRVRLTVKPDPGLAARQEEAEKIRLQQIRAGLSEQDVKQIIDRADKLEQRQNQVDDASILPKVELADVPADIKWPDSASHTISTGDAELPAAFFAQGTNGLNYQQVVIKLPDLPEELLPILPFYTSCLPELGLGERDYLEVQQLQSGICGGVNVYTSLRSAVDNEQQMQAYLVVSSKGLYRNQEAISQLLVDTLHDSRFDEHQRIREIVEQICSRKEQGITSHGHALAMGVATSRLRPIAALQYQQSGMAGIRYTKQLSRDLEQPGQLAGFAEKFRTLHDLI